MTAQATATTISNINIQNSVEDLILVLSDKERNVLTKRFSLDNKPKETLEKI
jgi:DNA-directed RNA polymerase sigma subunit (sigma70/sigma32)